MPVSVPTRFRTFFGGCQTAQSWYHQAKAHCPARGINDLAVDTPEENFARSRPNDVMNSWSDTTESHTPARCLSQMAEPDHPRRAGIKKVNDLLATYALRECRLSRCRCPGSHQSGVFPNTVMYDDLHLPTRVMDFGQAVEGQCRRFD